MQLGKLKSKEGDESELGGGAEAEKYVMYVFGNGVSGSLAIGAYGLTGHQEAPANGFLCGIESDTKDMYMSGVCLISLSDKASMEAAMVYAENQAQYETKGLSDSIQADLIAGKRVKFRTVEFGEECDLLDTSCQAL